MKKTVFFLALFFALNSCTQEELSNENSNIEMSQKNPLTEKQINERINQAIKMKELSIGRMNLIIFFGALFSVATEWYLLIWLLKR